MINVRNITFREILIKNQTILSSFAHVISLKWILFHHFVSLICLFHGFLFFFRCQSDVTTCMSMEKRQEGRAEWCSTSPTVSWVPSWRWAYGCHACPCLSMWPTLSSARLRAGGSLLVQATGGNRSIYNAACYIIIFEKTGSASSTHWSRHKLNVGAFSVVCLYITAQFGFFQIVPGEVRMSLFRSLTSEVFNQACIREFKSHSSLGKINGGHNKLAL